MSEIEDLEMRISSLEQLYGDVSSEVHEHGSSAKQRRTELLASMAAQIASGFVRSYETHDEHGEEKSYHEHARNFVVNSVVDLAERILARVEER